MIAITDDGRSMAIEYMALQVASLKPGEWLDIDLTDVEHVEAYRDAALRALPSPGGNLSTRRRLVQGPAGSWQERVVLTAVCKVDRDAWLGGKR